MEIRGVQKAMAGSHAHYWNDKTGTKNWKAKSADARKVILKHKWLEVSTIYGEWKKENVPGE